MDKIELKPKKFYLLTENFGYSSYYSELKEIEIELPTCFFFEEWWATHQVFIDNQRRMLLWLHHVKGRRPYLQYDNVQEIMGKIPYPEKIQNLEGVSPGRLQMSFKYSIIWRTF